MKITLNGNAHSIGEETTLNHLLESLDLAGKPVVAELNGQAILPRDFATTMIQAGDTLEIVVLAAGG